MKDTKEEDDDGFFIIIILFLVASSFILISNLNVTHDNVTHDNVTHDNVTDNIVTDDIVLDNIRNNSINKSYLYTNYTKSLIINDSYYCDIDSNETYKKINPVYLELKNWNGNDYVCCCKNVTQTNMNCYTNLSMCDNRTWCDGSDMLNYNISFNDSLIN